LPHPNLLDDEFAEYRIKDEVSPEF